MKIASVRADVYSHRFDGAAVTQGVGQMVKRDLVLVRVTAEDGTVGYGEAHHGLIHRRRRGHKSQHGAPRSGRGCTRDGGRLGAHIPPSDRDTWARRGQRHRPERNRHALWDLRGKLLRTPVFRLLGGARRKIRAYAGGMGLGWQPDTELEREVGRLMKAGYSAIKLRVGQELGADALCAWSVRTDPDRGG